MRRTATLSLLAGAIAAGGCATASAQSKTWDYAGGGQWPQARAATQPTERPANPALDRAQASLDARQWKPAKEASLAYVNANKTAPDRDRGLFILAESYFMEGDRTLAFYQFDELIETYPESPLFYPSLERQYAIADGYLNGYKNKLLFFRILGQTDEAIDMLFRIQERAPGSPLAERALLRTADYYFNSSQFDMAGDVYAAYARSYPRSPEIPRVRLRQAFSSYAQFRGPRFDATALIDARAQFEDVKARHPDIAAEANVQRFIDAINETLARKLATTADFYKRTDKTRAAVYTYRQLQSTYPNSTQAGRAGEELGRMPQWALETPMPGAAKPSEPPAGPSSRPAVAPMGPSLPSPAVVPAPEAPERDRVPGS